MKISHFLRLLERLRNEQDHCYAFLTGIGLLQPDPTQKPHALYQIRGGGTPYTCYVIRAINVAQPHGIPIQAVSCGLRGVTQRVHANWLDDAAALGLSVEAAGKILRAGEEIVVFDCNGKTRVRYNKQLRSDLLAAAGLEEHPEHRIVF